MDDIIIQAVRFLRNGGVISFPTETVYALAADATNKNAIERIYKIKGREFNKPLAVLVKNTRQAEELVQCNEAFFKLAAKFSPGPISYILPVKKNIKLYANQGLASLGVRIPDNKTALQILEAADFPVAATSTNPSGKKEATSANEVKDYFSSQIDMIIDSDDKCSGRASTIIDLCQLPPQILRVGEISEEEIRATIPTLSC